MPQEQNTCLPPSSSPRFFHVLLLILLFCGGWLFTAHATVSLPADLKWVTNDNTSDYTDPQAKRGGTFYDSVPTYPLTFRPYGPNANSGSFVSHNRRWSIDWSMTTEHPNTRELIPNLATHWAVLPDNKTVYYKLDPDVRWSDGKAVTADDYLFSYQFLRSKHIKAPYTKKYMEDYFESVDKIDDYTLRMVAKKPSWRILRELDFSPMPRHAIKLDKNWVKKYNWKPNVVVGPYALKKFKKGKFVEFHRVKNWWGDKKKRYQNKFNFKKFRVNVIRTREVEFEMFKKGKVDLYGVSDSTRWVKQTNFKAIKKGYINKQQILVDTPTGIRGVFLNAQDSLLRDIKVRRALLHLIDFKTINHKLLYNLSTRKHNFFDVSPPYKDIKVQTWPYDLKKANQLLDEAGWTGKRTAQGIRTKNGQLLKVVVSLGSKATLKYLTVIRESALKAGLEFQLKMLDGAALYKSVGQMSHQAAALGFAGGSYPSPRQFLHTDGIQKNSNNLFQFGSKEIDQLIEVYEFDMDEQKRIDAIFRIEQIVKENAILIPFWKHNHAKLLWWRHIKGPKGFITKSGIDYDLLWYDKEEKEKIKQYKKSGKSFSRLPLDADPFGIKS
ncbi:MAG: hypothetical protein COB67_07715 [SAR324 cluster bacterium]|uniref:Solute-binding protein family 5 domain-containing protein n=1 Tax=SAR324 cluster bacterium TaxID=2024889 RepID=A0A2A4T2G4_9DELT|nr:MAG: hypothetical protein COB67_07715 [SAR324 cluster bacterium]